MNITKNKDGSKLTLTLEGRLDTTTAPQLEGELKSTLEEPGIPVLRRPAGTAGRSEGHEQTGEYGDSPCERDHSGGL